METGQLFLSYYPTICSRLSCLPRMLSKLSGEVRWIKQHLFLITKRLNDFNSVLGWCNCNTPAIQRQNEKVREGEKINLTYLRKSSEEANPSSDMPKIPALQCPG